MTLRRVLLVFAILFAGLSISALATERESDSLEAGIELSDGSQLDGQLLSIDSDTALFEIDGRDRTFSIKSVSRLRFSDSIDHPKATAKIVRLVDGSNLICKSVKLEDGKLKATTENGEEFESNSRLIDFVRFTVGVKDLDEAWEKSIDQKRESDALIVARDQKLQTIDGVIGEVTAEAVSFTVGERTADVKRSRLSGILFYRRIADDFAPALCVLELTDGSRIQVRSVSVKEGAFEISSVAGMSCSVTSDSVASIDFGANRSVWLTDLEPATNDWIPLLASRTILGSLRQFSIARIDKNFSGKSLSVLTTDDEFNSDATHRKEFEKGFAIKGGGKLSFRLAKQYRRLSGLIAFDPDANATGTVRLIVQIDGKNRIDEVLDAPSLRKPFEVDIDLLGADRIVFQVDYHDRRSIGDILHAVDMKLHR
jgi:hypothetical protein